jgi:exodeoxyribonuclease VII large subunit
LERLKAKLAGEGLFERERKRRLPRWPRVVGIVTSIKGAVLHDIVRVAARRCPTRFLVAPAAVQGVDAPADLVRALAELQAIEEVDVVIVARGGGASEDLMAFNDEGVVRAIAACRVPVVSAVGHEVDVTLADLVADVRAATPSQAAEIVVQDLRVVRRELAGWTRRLESATGRRLLDARAAFDARIHRLDRGGRKLIASQRGRMDLLATRLERALRRRLQLARARQVEAKTQLERLHPRRRIQEDRRRLQAIETRLARSMLSHRQESRQRFVALTSKLDALSPLAVLARGYAVVVREDARLVTDAAALRLGERVDVRVASGRFVAQVIERPAASPSKTREQDAAATQHEDTDRE